MGILGRYGDFFPLTPRTPRLDLGEGSTPLVPLRALGEELGVDLWGKFEGANPTGSFKDRGMVLAVSKAMEEGARGVICASTGNTSASAAAYAACGGLSCTVLLPSGNVAKGKVAQALIYGATVAAVRGNFDRALELARAMAERRGYRIVNSVNPFRLRGQMSGAFEICDQLGDAPDWLAIPVGNAGNVTAYWAGFVAYMRRRRSSRVPVMMGFQAQGACPMVTGQFTDHPETVATAIRIGRPVNARRARWAVMMSGGAFEAVEDREILRAQMDLARCGLFAEPASCTPLAGLRKLAREGRLPRGIRVVMVLTGNGLKDVETPLRSAGSVVELEDSLETLEGVIP
ncbi:threonine synthase [Thermanaerovibrio acidaminovorans DSM 6589]|uniref:Threonine synthase n=1 Tax=Thermanaerovibrio acidaminovorans (strain ATCC 49978 / DSM 6589 / Su883) TaxID=525903 RepID=D1B631_THEAS|nr:threonine synthase [Thermanaerovibrio acidaminovorans]ACZ19472.1 threonine synthase [Thermanaerovibrio acidaminovorans DSM 6589]